MKKRVTDGHPAHLVRSSSWHGVAVGDGVVVDTDRERRHQWVFVAHVRNVSSGDEWVEVRGGRAGEAKGRSFRPDVIYPLGARRGSRIVGLSLAHGPQLPLGS